MTKNRMSNHCVHLNLHMNPVTIDHSKLKNTYQTNIPIRLLNPDLISILNKCNIKINYATSFYSPPGYIQTIHTDESGGDYVKLNYVFGGSGSQMHWYSVKDNILPRPISFTDVRTPFLSWDINEVNLVQSDTLSHPSLVQVGCPHNMTNLSEHRLCIALVLIDVSNLQRIPIDLAKDKLIQHVI